MYEEIIAAGFGGQGIMVLGRILAFAAMIEHHQVTFIPAYGAEVRGGTANCSVIISDRAIHSPIVAKPSAMIIMNQLSFEHFVPEVDDACLMLINSSMVECDAPSENMILIPFSELAVEIGNIKAANMIALGSLAKKKGLVTLESLNTAVKKMFPWISGTMMALNLNAIKKGVHLI